VRKLLLIVVSLFFVFSCKKETDPLLLFLSPSQVSYSQKPDDIIIIEISGSSGNTLTRFKINQREVNSVSTTLLDSSIYGNTFSYTFEYKVPATIVNTTYYIEMSIYDDTGDKNSAAISVDIHPVNILFTETAGHEIFSHASTGYDAFNLALRSPLHSEITDSSEMDILDLTNDTINPNILLRKWGSPAGNKFVRFTDFDYANTTFNSVRNSYNAGIKNTFIENISSGDIILTKIGNPFVDTGYVAIKVVLVIDEDSTQLDRYIFNIKK
jgi:hypothetical protein